MRPNNHAVGLSHLHRIKNNTNSLRWERLDSEKVIQLTDAILDSVQSLYQIFASESGEAVKLYEANRKDSPDA